MIQAAAGGAVEPKPALAVQTGGRHYKDMKIQPVEYINANGLGFMEGSVIKYISRHRNKNGVEDLKKARHFIDLLIELEYPNVDIDNRSEELREEDPVQYAKRRLNGQRRRAES